MYARDWWHRRRRSVPVPVASVAAFFLFAFYYIFKNRNGGGLWHRKTGTAAAFSVAHEKESIYLFRMCLNKI